MNYVVIRYSFSTLEALMNMDHKKIDLDLIITLVDHICSHKGVSIASLIRSRTDWSFNIVGSFT